MVGYCDYTIFMRLLHFHSALFCGTHKSLNKARVSCVYYHFLSTSPGDGWSGVCKGVVQGYRFRGNGCHPTFLLSLLAKFIAVICNCSAKIEFEFEFEVWPGWSGVLCRRLRAGQGCRRSPVYALFPST